MEKIKESDIITININDHTASPDGGFSCRLGLIKTYQIQIDNDNTTPFFAFMEKIKCLIKHFKEVSVVFGNIVLCFYDNKGKRLYVGPDYEYYHDDNILWDNLLPLFRSEETYVRVT